MNRLRVDVFLGFCVKQVAVVMMVSGLLSLRVGGGERWLIASHSTVEGEGVEIRFNGNVSTVVLTGRSLN